MRLLSLVVLLCAIVGFNEATPTKVWKLADKKNLNSLFKIRKPQPLPINRNDLNSNIPGYVPGQTPTISRPTLPVSNIPGMG
jgi:hypothetical protein